MGDSYYPMMEWEVAKFFYLRSTSNEKIGFWVPFVRNHSVSCFYY